MDNNQRIWCPSLQIKYNLQNNQTLDAESKHEPAFIDWEPTWFQIQNPEKYSLALNICPVCIQIVPNNEQNLICKSPQNRLYLAHSQCAFSISKITEYTEIAKKARVINKFNEFTHKIGSNQYMVEISFEHPISQKKFYSNKRKLFQDLKSISYHICEDKFQNFEPNIVVIPVTQFKCRVNIRCLSSTYKQKIFFKVDLHQQNSGVFLISFSKQQLTFYAQFQIIPQNVMKKQIISKMNFKYNRPYQLENFIKFNGFIIEFQKQKSISNPNSFIKKQDKSLKDEGIQGENRLLNQINQLSHIQIYDQTENLNESEFINHIKTQNGSKQFQKKIKTYKNEDIEAIIVKILPFLQEIILNQYANYMFQSLLSVCTFEQRMKIIQKICPSLSKLVCQQQGTFVFQQLISFLTHNQQYEYICVSVSKDFKHISFDNYGNHFMRKLIQNMPKQKLNLFLPTVYENFSKFAKDKNAVCVMKCVLKSLKDGENFSNQLALGLKRFIDNLTLNSQQLINDQFGNYLIQQSYILLEVQRLNGVSQYIINFFQNCSCQKISSNVVLNCIKTFWKNSPQVYQTLKQRLDKKSIVSMYHNREGNKVLLQIMELPIQLSVKDKISATIQNEGLSKYNNRRWASKTGKSNTGTVSSTHSNFSEAHHAFGRRKNYN